ncbi:hypothetical protein [Rhodococcus tibetensis]|uniref:Fe-S oxidoreductase n=1 Tax=Rhodococcus tibetensis TaxID=2965064 RepID=A0ABT1QGR2_9NOCA|nr:hypothetical protein [Rhodococcus sp. FXJ9.536]MCQ4121469.1 hypothetical protein [Rhodococcus sp. FXJ9.536]
MRRSRGVPMIRATRGNGQSAAITCAALAYARVWGGRTAFDEEFGIFVCSGMRGGFARGGTTIGGAFLTGRTPARTLLRHEAVHADQWATYGWSFALRYLFEELRHRGARNRFEIAAGLADGGYRVS